MSFNIWNKIKSLFKKKDKPKTLLDDIYDNNVYSVTSKELDELEKQQRAYEEWSKVLDELSKIPDKEPPEVKNTKKTLSGLLDSMKEKDKPKELPLPSVSDEEGVWITGIDTPDDFPDIVNWPEEFFDVAHVKAFGARKHGPDSWLDPMNPSLEHKANFASIFRHVSEAYTMPNFNDPESDLDPLLHAACRLLMAYVRKQRGIDTFHPDEE